MTNEEVLYKILRKGVEKELEKAESAEIPDKAEVEAYQEILNTCKDAEGIVFALQDFSYDDEDIITIFLDACGDKTELT